MLSKEDKIKSEDSVQIISEFETSNNFEKDIRNSKENPRIKSKGSIDSSFATVIIGMLVGACIGGIRGWGIDELLSGKISIEILIEAFRGIVTGAIIGLIIGLIINIGAALKSNRKP
jgi:hypothetical protein